MKIPYITCQVLALSSLAGGASAQHVSFSIDWRSPTVSVLDTATLTPITSGDILVPAAGIPGLGPLLVPSTGVPHGPGGLGLMPGCVGVPGGTPCPVEVDAFSYGLDDPMHPGGLPSGALLWSVDTFATGMAPVAPNITSEAPVGDSATDIMRNVGFLPMLPLPPGPSIGHRGLFDGDGLPSATGFAYGGLGLMEPSPPTALLAAVGDNLDAMDVLMPGGAPPPVSYFSLDGVFPDPMTGLPSAATAATHMFAGSDVLKSVPGFAPILYAPALALGLDFFGPHSDDLDALILAENGDGIYTPSVVPFDWMGGTTDMLLFSVRRGSMLIGSIDSLLGVPIEEGDILTTPPACHVRRIVPLPRDSDRSRKRWPDHGPLRHRDGRLRR